MKGYTSETIRNVALLGHGGCGKTTFLEAALLATGVTNRMGKVEDGNTVSDYDKMEIEKGFSINTSVVPILWKENKINFIDTPGYFDFVGEVNAALRAAEAAVIMVDAGSGIQVGTEAAWKACERYKRPRFIVINKRDKDEFDFYKTFGELKDKFGEKLIPFSWPLSAEIDEELKEAIAMADEELMEKYFEGEDFTEEEILNGLKKGIADGGIVPVCSSAFQLGAGLEGLLDPPDHTEWLSYIRELKEKYPLRYDMAELTGPSVIEAVYRATGGEAIITTDVGQHQMWAAQYYKYTEPRTFLSSGGLGTMGYGLGAAIGAKCGRPDKTVINIAGDGCFRMNMNELATASRFDIPVIEIVVNNKVLGMVRQWQTLFYGQRYSATILDDKVDFVKVAEGLGVKAVRVTKLSELLPAVEQAVKEKVPYMIEVQIDKDDKVFPMVAAGAPIDQAFDSEDLKNK